MAGNFPHFVRTKAHNYPRRVRPATTIVIVILLLLIAGAGTAWWLMRLY